MRGRLAAVPGVLLGLGLGALRDELLLPTLKHDPYVLAMANSGPNTTGSQIYFTGNSGLSWSNITGNLDSELWTVVFIPGPVDNVVVGGRDGVFLMRVDAPGVWMEFGQGLPNAPVYVIDRERRPIGQIDLGTLLRARGAERLDALMRTVPVTLPAVTPLAGAYAHPAWRESDVWELGHQFLCREIYGSH